MRIQVMLKAVLLLSFFTFIKNIFLSGRPDAIRCGAGNQGGAIYFAHGLSNQGISQYNQVVGDIQNRYITFNGDGTFNSGGGHQGSRAGCQGKSISQLQSQGRNFYFSHQVKSGQHSSGSSNFWAYENIKQLWYQEFRLKIMDQIDDILKQQREKIAEERKLLKEQWYKQFKQQILDQIKTNGLQIGSRWRIVQQTTYFVIRDVEGSKVRDSRVAFPALSYLNPT